MIRRLFYTVLILITACVDPLKVDEPENNRRIVVDGIITNAPGPYQVKLFYTNKLNTTRLVAFEPVTNALVAIHDDLNNVAFLTEVSPGLYMTNENDMRGELGRSYHVNITTSNEKEYRSAPQRLTSAGEVTHVYFEFVKDALPGSQSDSFVDGLKVFMDTKGDLGGSNLYRWRWTTIHKVKSNPELETRTTPGGEIPIPQPCSGYIYQQRQLIQVGECTCCICWSYNYSENAQVSKNELVNQNTYNKIDLGIIPVTSMHFYDKYYLEAQQLSLSEEAYDFWNLVEKQQSGATDLFQPNAIKIRGNIENVADPDEEVLGYFSVSGVASKGFYIDLQEIPYTLPEIETVPFPCTQYFKNPTTTEPWFW